MDDNISFATNTAFQPNEPSGVVNRGPRHIYIHEQQYLEAGSSTRGSQLPSIDEQMMPEYTDNEDVYTHY